MQWHMQILPQYAEHCKQTKTPLSKNERAMNKLIKDAIAYII